MTFLCLTKILVEGILDLCGLGGEYVQWQKELQHCIVTYSQELNIMHTQSILYSYENNFRPPALLLK